MSSDPEKLLEMFFPYTSRRLTTLGTGRVAHYTSAAVAQSIIANRELWLGNSGFANDYLEVHHGHHCLFSALSSDDYGWRMKQMIDPVFPQLWDRAVLEFESTSSARIQNSYFFSVSEHGSSVCGASSDHEDNHGRLSMWRAYGGDTSVALVFSSDPLRNAASQVPFFSSPVFYGNSQDFAVEFGMFLDGLEAEKECWRQFDEDTLSGLLRTVFLGAVLSTKHPGFSEEREWRVIYEPNLPNPTNITPKIVTLKGVPQQVVKLPLRNDSANGINGMELADILDRVIIGPMQNAAHVRDTFVKILKTADVPDAERRVVLSGIPLRRQ